MIPKYVKRKNGNKVWEVWAHNDESVSVMSVSGIPNSRIIKMLIFKKDWEKV